MEKIIYLLVILTIIASSCEIEPDSNDPAGIIELKSSDLYIAQQNNTFSFNIFNEILKNDSIEKNTFISPLSMYFALAMAYNGSDGETRDEFIEILGWTDLNDNEILESLKKLHDYLLNGSVGVEVALANSIWPRIDFTPKQEFIDVNKEYLYAEVKPLDFSLPDALAIINGWIENNTNGKITDALDQIPPDAIMYLINTIYFNATWKYKFDIKDNTSGNFYLHNGTTTEVTYMNNETNLPIYYGTNYNAVKMPYADSNFYMLVMLPNGDFSPIDIAASLDTTRWNTMQSSFNTENLKIRFPKFKFVYGTRLINDELKALGLMQAFYLGADFSKITDGDIFISRVLHKAFVDVSEKGTEAAAVTIIEFRENAVQNTEFHVNRPFLFAICEEKTDAILFMGRVMMPAYE